MKDAVASLDIQRCLRLPQPEATRDELRHAMRWVTDSEVYRIIDEQLRDSTASVRKHRTGLEDEGLQLIFDLRKVETPPLPPVAYCNVFDLTEEREEALRRRIIVEPVINDILERCRDQYDGILSATTKYTPKEDIRRSVFENSCAAQFDFAAYFDQFALAKSIRKYFGIARRNDDDLQLCVLAMGYRPSCQVAQATTKTIMSVKEKVDSASCVDNVLFLGTPGSVFRASKQFIVRSAIVGAQLKDTTIAITTEYDFLGEHYDHVAKTRCLTKKTAAKAAFVGAFMLDKKPLRTKQLQAIFGLLLYAANTLRLTIANYHWALRFMSKVCASEQQTEHDIPDDVRGEFLSWARVASTNTPVDVYTPDIEADFIIYTDASAYGWGAISISRGGNVKTISKQWSPQECEEHNVYSSVVAEPLAIRKAIAALVPATTRKVTIFTDHLPFVFAAEATYGKAWSYSSAIQFLAGYKTEFDVQFVPGAQNPADVLSRARPITTTKPIAPLLSVTSVAGRRCGRREAWGWAGEGPGTG